MKHLSCAPIASILVVVLCGVGCVRLPVRSTPANLAALSEANDRQRARLTDADVQAMLDRKPLVRFPAGIAVAQVQAAQANAYYGSRANRGAAFHVVFNREAETPEHVAALAGLEQIHGVSALSPLVLSGPARHDRDLRAAAGRLNADLLLLYTFDTAVYRGDNTSPLDVVTLGFLPHRHMRVRCTASAMLLDTRNGYVYATSEGSATTKQLANTWTTRDAVDQSRRRAEQQALDQMVERFVAGWPAVLARHGGRAGLPGPRYETASGP